MKTVKFFSVSALLLFAAAATFAQNSGTTGPLTWVYTPADNTLTISGSGEMPDYLFTGEEVSAPWYHLYGDMKRAVINSGVTKIGDYAFFTCTSLTAVTIPNSVTVIGEVAFGVCTSLPAIEVDAGNPNYSSTDGVLFNKDKTFLIQYPAGKTETAYTIPASVTTIEFAAFIGCDALTAVTIGSSVTSIGEYAFEECPLTEVINLATTPQAISATVFQDLDMTACTLKVPAASVALYKAADEWKDFGTIEAIGGTGIDETGIETLITIYPNPVKDVLNIESGELGIETVEIVDVSGKTVSTFSNAENKINVSHLSAGIYFIKIETNEGVVTRKFVKE